MANEKRLIDANELIRDAEDYAPVRGGLADLYDVKWLVDAQLTVDAVEVVRCKDCKHWYKSKEFSPFGWCCQRNDIAHVSYRDRTNPEDFCSRGERRTNEKAD